MFEKLSFTRLAKQFKQRGQVSILFSLLMPIFLLFLGVGLDLGWYYINVSRLQNAADAAAVAGAQTLLDSETFSDYKNPTLISKYPGKVSNEYRGSFSNIYEQTAFEAAKLTATESATEYAAKNLSGNENSLINSWTNNKVEFQSPKLYAQDDNLYFVVQLKDSIRHFFLSGWFDDMDAPVTAVAMLSRTATVNTNTKTSDDSEMPAAPSTPEMPGMSLLPDMPTLPDNPLIISETIKTNLESDKNKNVIVGNWEVQNEYRIKYGDKDEATRLKYQARYEAIFKGTFYTERWNHFQDFRNHYVRGNLYRTGTVTVLDDVETDDGGNITSYGVTSSVAATAASITSDHPGIKARKTYKAGITDTDTVGLPYTWDKLDSINIDFRPDVILSGDWLEEDWDISKGFNGVSFTSHKDWSDPNIGRLRIHTSINFDGVYAERDNDKRQDENKNSDYDILWTRIESEPILSQPDLINDEVKTTYKTGIKTQTNLNSVNQIIINANESNAGKDERGKNYRPYIIFYDGPETNDVYIKEESNKKHVRDSLPVILNLNVPFNAILYAPNSPVVIIGDAKDNFSGFVVAKKYMRLKDDNELKLYRFTVCGRITQWKTRCIKSPATKSPTRTA